MSCKFFRCFVKVKDFFPDLFAYQCFGDIPCDEAWGVWDWHLFSHGIKLNVTDWS